LTEGNYVASLKKMLTRHILTAGDQRGKGLELTAAAIEIRQSMRNEHRHNPTLDEAKALIMISEAAQRLSPSGIMAPDMCFLTVHELEDYGLLVDASKNDM